MRCVFMDMEMKPVSTLYPEAKRSLFQEIIQIGAVKSDAEKEYDSFSKLIKPCYGPIPPRYTKLTGITPEQLDTAGSLEEAVDAFITWCVDTDIIYAWSGNDLVQLQAECAYKQVEKDLSVLTARWKDYQRIYTDKVGLYRELSLEQAIHIAGLDFEGHMHDALWDARNTAALYRSAENPETFKIAEKKTGSVNKKTAPTQSLADLFADKLKGLTFDE